MSHRKDQENINKEVEKHKWIESEKVGKDIGWYRAKVDWLINHFGDYVKSHPLSRKK